MAFQETSVPAGTMTEKTEPETTRDSWTEFDNRTGKNHQIAHLYQTTIAARDEAGIGANMTISELVYTSGWSETI
jgi:hypothetical protein